MTTHSPHSVVLAALMHPVPCPRCASTVPCRCAVDPGERLEWQAQLVVQALASQSLLADEHLDRPPPTPVALAQRLADESRHPRYVDQDQGWRQLLASENNIHHAHASALRAHPHADREYERELSQIRDSLLAVVTQRRAAANGG